MFQIISLSVLLFDLLSSPLLVMESWEPSICSPDSYISSLYESNSNMLTHLSLASRWKLRTISTVTGKEQSLWSVFLLKDSFNNSNLLRVNSKIIKSLVGEFVSSWMYLLAEFIKLFLRLWEQFRVSRNNVHLFHIAPDQSRVFLDNVSVRRLCWFAEKKVVVLVLIPLQQSSQCWLESSQDPSSHHHFKGNVLLLRTIYNYRR